MLGEFMLIFGLDRLRSVIYFLCSDSGKKPSIWACLSAERV